MTPNNTPLFKDAVLDRLARRGNVAQFISFGPGKTTQRFSRVSRHQPNHRFANLRTAIRTLFKASLERSLNVRSFTPQQAQGRTFIYGLRNVDDVLSALRRLSSDGLYSIVNETIDVNDGGISGVALADLVEFAPGDTPRAVEKGDVAELPLQKARQLIKTVYGFTPRLPAISNARTEFSIHPLRRGYRNEHTILWEFQKVARTDIEPVVVWPNRFSRFIGDKAYGLLIAEIFGLRVPRTQVICRGMSPFSFGDDTPTHERWLRTCPREQVPGKYTTHFGWIDPFKVLQDEDPAGTEIASVLSQHAVESRFSGALITDAKGNVLLEGVAGSGVPFMLGQATPVQLTTLARNAVLSLYRRAVRSLGPVRMEWVFDGKAAWVVQMHVGRSKSVGRTIFPGRAKRWHKISATVGVEGIERLVRKLRGLQEGVILVGPVGMTSHIADHLRRAEIPSRIEPHGTIRATT